VKSFGVVPCSDEETGCSVDTDPVKLEQFRCSFGDERGEHSVDVCHLGVEPFDPSRQVSDHHIRGVGHRVRTLTRLHVCRLGDQTGLIPVLVSESDLLGCCEHQMP
jgi:hypothetical protein